MNSDNTPTSRVRASFSARPWSRSKPRKVSEGMRMHQRLILGLCRPGEFESKLEKSSIIHKHQKTFVWTCQIPLPCGMLSLHPNPSSSSNQQKDLSSNPPHHQKPPSPENFQKSSKTSAHIVQCVLTSPEDCKTAWSFAYFLVFPRHTP
jgi:hypothetical protein